ncbi:MAG: OmpA family protein [Burkholderiales bacterium]
MSIWKIESGMAVKASRNVLVILLLGLGLAGCAGKANRDGSGNSSMNSKGAVSPAEQAALERKALEEQQAQKAAEAAAAAKRAAGGVGADGNATNGRSLPDQLAADFDSNRDFQKRGFFDEEEYAFAPGLSDAERIAARVEAARRRAGLTDSNEEYASAFAFGPYSRIYQQEGDVSGLVALDAKGHLKGWATAGEVTADGTVFFGGASEKALAKLDAEEGFVGSKGGRRSTANRNRNGAIDVAASKSSVNEDFIPQTLGGALPMVLGVEENGQFDFDNYLLRDEVKAKLDKLAHQLEGAEYDRLDILGYTDRIGDTEYNKQLSRKRALAVARYLRDRGVPEYKIMVTGKGQDNPLTKREDCEGLQLEDLISCLQPDRRVEIEASILRTSVELE